VANNALNNVPVQAERIQWNGNQREELWPMRVSPSSPALDVLRVLIMLMQTNGRSYSEVPKCLQTTAPTIARRNLGFLRRRLDGLLKVGHRAEKPAVITRRRKLTDVSTHWYVRKLARESNTGVDAVRRIWRRAGIRPHRPERYRGDGASDFEASTYIIALSLNLKSGKVRCKTARCRIREQFVDVLDQIVAICKPHQKVCILVYHLSANKFTKFAEFLQFHPQLKLQFRPTCASWLNQVETWFARIEHAVVTPASVPDLPGNFANPPEHFSRYQSERTRYC